MLDGYRVPVFLVGQICTALSVRLHQVKGTVNFCFFSTISARVPEFVSLVGQGTISYSSTRTDDCVIRDGDITYNVAFYVVLVLRKRTAWLHVAGTRGNCHFDGHRCHSVRYVKLTINRQNCFNGKFHPTKLLSKLSVSTG